MNASKSKSYRFRMPLENLLFAAVAAGMDSAAPVISCRLTALMLSIKGNLWRSDEAMKHHVTMRVNNVLFSA